MYKMLLCWRYLKTRYLAFACIISVMLGVATLIVVNSVMNGFSMKLKTLLHSVVSDVSIEAASMEGMRDPMEKLAKIRRDPYLNSQIESMTVTLEAFAMVQYRNLYNEIQTRPVRIIGIEPKTRTQVGGFNNHLVRQKGTVPNFDLPDDIRARFEEAEMREEQNRVFEQFLPTQVPKEDANIGIPKDLQHLFKNNPDEKPLAKPMAVPHIARMPKGAIVGHLIAHRNYRAPDGKIEMKEDIRMYDTVVLTTVSGERLTPVYDSFVVVDYFKSEMSEYDSNCVFIPLEHLQALRVMENRASSILVKVKSYDEAENVVKALAALFEHEPLSINTWEQKQGPLLRAIEIEKSILNILLFMIIAVAGFGILAIFSMIVSEKTRDIGILKALGASNGGVMRIFLTYGLLLGVVGSLLGTILGLTITWNINGIEALIAYTTGSKIFTGDVYYFSEIPANVEPMAIVLVNVGAVAIAAVFSIIPALRAAWLHPVQALRYE